jgi:hypothetical protein
MRFWRIVSAGFAFLTLSTMTGMSAFARAEPSPAWNDVLAVEGHLGVATPVGFGGLALDLTPHPKISFNAGVGRGLYALQLAGMARVRPIFIAPGIAPGIGAGVSGGDTGTTPGYMDPRELRFQQAIWANVEAFLEFRWGAFHLRPFLGIAQRVHDASCTWITSAGSQPCSTADQTEIGNFDRWRRVVYTGAAIGFGLF